MPAPSVTVVVPTYQGKHHLEQLLPSLAEQTLAHEVVIVDNGSHDGTVGFVRDQWPSVKLLELNENVGFARAVNAGADAASGATLVFLNNDTVCTPTFLERLVAVLDPATGTVMAAPVLLRRGNIGRIDTAGIVLDRSLHGFNYLYGEPADVLERDLPPPLAPCGGAAAFDRLAFQELGGFDPSFFAYVEDVDLAIRCVSRGWRCGFARDAVAVHAHSGTLGEGSRMKNHLTGWGRGYIVGKYRLHRKPGLLGWSLAVELVMAIGKLVIDRDLDSTRAFVGGWAAGISAPAEKLPDLRRHAGTLNIVSGFSRRLTRRFVLRSHAPVPPASMNGGW